MAEQLGERVRFLRKRKKKVQKELADEVYGRQEATSISRLERGVAVPSLKMLEKVAQRLGVALRDLFDFDGPADDQRKEALRGITAMLSNRPLSDLEDAREVLAIMFDTRRRAKRRKATRDEG